MTITICTTSPDIPDWVVDHARTLGVTFHPLQSGQRASTVSEHRTAIQTALGRETVAKLLDEIHPAGYLMNGPPDYGPYVDVELVSASPDLRLVTYFGDSFNPDLYAPFLDLDGLHEHGITVTTTPGARQAVAEGTFALLLALNLDLVRLNASRKQGLHHSAGTRVGLENRTLGIAGMGQIGTRVAELGRAIGMNIAYTAQSRKPEYEELLDARFLPLPDLFQASDYVTIHLPGETTDGLIDREILSRSTGLTLINTTTRPTVVDPLSLIEALDDGRVARVAIEGTYPEPYDRQFQRYGDDRVLLLPAYTSWDTVQSIEAGWHAYLRTLEAFVKGGTVPNQLRPRR